VPDYKKRKGEKLLKLSKTNVQEVRKGKDSKPEEEDESVFQ